MKRWYNEDIRTVLSHFSTNPQTGLSDAEVKLALEKHGPNKLVGTPKKSLFSLFISQMKDALIYVLLGAALVTLVIGLVGMIDPPRLEVRDAISKAAHAGIKAVMITGDHKNTAFSIAKELGIACLPEYL